jgi:hypothetical protein
VFRFIHQPLSRFLAAASCVAPCFCLFSLSGAQSCWAQVANESDSVATLFVSTNNINAASEDLQRLNAVFDQAKKAFEPAEPAVRFERPSVLRGPTMLNEVFNAIQGLNVKTNTTLFCYCKLHGNADEKGRHTMALDEDDIPLPREDLVAELKKKHARLTILITESCTVGPVQRRIIVKQPEVAFPKPLFRDLFLVTTDFVDLNSASPIVNGKPVFQAAWCDLDGALFTRGFCELLSEGPKAEVAETYGKLGGQNHRVSWAEFTEALKARTDARFREFKGIVGNVPGRLDKYPNLRDQANQFPYAYSPLPTAP